MYGADRVLLGLLPVLAERFDVVLCVPIPGPLVERARRLGVETLVLPDYAIRRRHLTARAVLPWFARVGRGVVGLHRLHRRDPFDLIYSGTLASGLGSIVKLWWRVPHVLHVHEYPYHGRISRTVLLGWVRATADTLICISAYVRDACGAVVPQLADRSIVVHNGVDPEAVREPAMTDRGRGAPLRVICAGRINGWKGQEMLVDAARIARESDARWELHFFGDWLPEDAHVARTLQQQVEENGLDDITTFHGFVADQDVVYAAADVVVVPSTVPEPFGLTVLEAQVRGIPVVATALGGPAEIVQDCETGYLVPPSDPHGLAAAIMALDNDELRATLGHNGQRRARSRFAWPESAHRVADVLERSVLRPAHRGLRTGRRLSGPQG